MLTYFTVLLIKERVSKLKYPMLPLYLKMQCIMNRKVCIKCKKLLNKRGTTSRNHINLNFLAIMLHLCLNYYKDSWTFVQQLERSCTENCFSSISKYGQTLEFKKGQNSPQNERLNEIPCQWWEGVAYLLAWVWGPPWPCPGVEPPVADSPSLTVGTRTEYTGCCWILSETSQVLVGLLWNITNKNNDIAL